MKLLKLTVLPSLLFAFLFIASSCEKEAEKKKANVYTKSDLIMSGAQSVPATSTSGSGTLSVSYDKRTRILNYTITWFGLSGNPTGIGIFGPAPEGYMALSPSFTPAPALQTVSVSGLAASGTYSGTLFADGTKIVEQDLLNYLYYVRISTASAPLGEIRTQIKFQ